MGTIQLLSKNIAPRQGGDGTSRDTLEQGTHECIAGASEASQYCSIWEALFTPQKYTRSGPTYQLRRAGHDGVWYERDINGDKAVSCEWITSFRESHDV